MGLDMYLEARQYVSKYESYKTDMLSPKYQELLKGLPSGIDEFGDFGGAEIAVTIGYWRKVNQVHGWIIENCADGEDKCQEIPIRVDKLMELRALCEEVLDNPDSAMEHLPPAQGFFFGTYEIDEWYFEGLRLTKAIMDKALSLPEDDFSFVYRSSW